MAKKVTIDGLDKAIQNELSLYSKSVTQNIKKANDDVMKEIVTNTKNDAPVRKSKGGGKYKRAITSKTMFENSFGKVNVWYVKAPHYRLSHLLEKGHAKRNGGRTRAFPHIANNVEIAKNHFEKKIEEAIKNEH